MFKDLHKNMSKSKEKNTDKVKVSIVVSETIHKKLVDESLSEKRSVSSQCALIIEKYYDGK